MLKEIVDEVVKGKPAITWQAGRDIKLDLDQRLHDAIMDRLGLPVLSEEGNQFDYTTQPGAFYILDPLDGSWNHFRGIPFCCVSLALCVDGEIKEGHIYDWQRNEMFAVAGGRAVLNGEEIHVSGKQEILATGFPSWRDYSDQAMEAFIGNFRIYKKVRMIGSAALSLAWMACGRIDAYVEEDIRIWDVAAGLALVDAAGGQIRVSVSDRENFVTAKAWCDNG